MRCVMLALVLLVAGCTTAPDPEPVPTSTPPVSGPSEPEGLEAMGFKLLGAIAQGGPVYGAGEPSIWAAADGTVYAAFPGCDAGPYYLVPRLPGSPSCEHGLVWRSDDAGETWTRLNDPVNGRLTDDGPAANGDADVTTDANGTVYASNLGGGIQVLKSTDLGGNWSYVGNVVPPGHWADRQWMSAGEQGHLVMAWMGGTNDPRTRQVAVNTTFDGGETWTGVQYLGRGIGWLGTVRMDGNGGVYVPFTQNDGGSFSLHTARSLDGGRSWEAIPTGVTLSASLSGGHWSGVLMAPALAVTGDGTLVWVWSEEVSLQGATATGTQVKAIGSKDRGESWSDPIVLSTSAQAIQPWATGGAGDRFAVSWYASDAPGDSDVVGGQWRVDAVQVDGIDPDAIVHSTIDDPVHIGPLCSKGSGCVGPYDRALLDFFESDVLPDGRLIVIYPADPATEGGAIDIRVAIQDSGTRLLAPQG